jgi:ribonuclease HI
MRSPVEIFCDGGVIGPNPSIMGGTWAWCWVDELNCRIKHNSGVITPKEAGVVKVTNNLTELIAAINAIHSVERDWEGTLYTDSLVTLHRLKRSEKFNGIPNKYRMMVLDIRRLYRGVTYQLIGGHPTRKELAAGKNNKGMSVSPHNVFCDRECTDRANWYKSLSIRQREV